MNFEEVYIVSACRTGIGAFNGQYSKINAVTLGSTVIKHCLERAKIAPENVSEVIMGHVLTAGQGPNPARQASIHAGIQNEVPAYTINMLCGSGLKAIYLGFQSIRSCDSKIVVCGGQENMTMAHHAAFIRNGTKLGGLELQDTILRDALIDAFNKVHMGSTAEFLARKYSVPRKEQDEFAYQSQLKAAKATAEGHFVDEIVPVVQIKPPLSILKDEFIKPDATLEKLSQLPTVFEMDRSKNPTVTAGNSSGINDGAAAILLCNKAQLDIHNLKPLAKIVACTQTGLEPMEMGLGPISAIKQILKMTNWDKDEVDLYEVNEAFAAQSLVVLDKLQLDRKKVNITGGAIALGHPIGSSGARILVTLIYNLKRLGLKRGIASLCIGGGMGIAVAIESC